MIIDSPIDLELTQISGQTSQPPWICKDGVYSDLVCVDGEAAIFNVSQKGKYLDFNYSGNITKNQAIENVKKIYDLDFDLLTKFIVKLKKEELYSMKLLNYDFQKIEKVNNIVNILEEI